MNDIIASSHHQTTIQLYMYNLGHNLSGKTKITISNSSAVADTGRPTTIIYNSPTIGIIIKGKLLKGRTRWN